MSNRYPGGFITLDEPTVNTSEADGIWTLEQQAGYQGQGVWPLSFHTIQRSLRFNSADSANLSWTPASAGNRKTWTWSAWVKLGAVTGSNALFAANASATAISFTTYSSALRFEVDGTYGGTRHLRYTTAIYRDPSAWYHIVVALDTTQATDTNRLKAYINGEQIALDVAGVGSWPAQNSEGSINNNIEHCLGERIFTDDFKYNGYMAEVHFVDGQALTPSDFGYTDASTGVWTPIAYAGTYGQNGFYLPFNDNSAAINLGLNGIPYTTDQAWPNTSLLLNTNGTNAAQSNTFLDSSDNAFTVTRNGNTTQGRFSPFAVADGEWSVYFNGSSGLSVPDSADFTLGSSDWTIECWVYQTTSVSQGEILRQWGSGTKAWIFYINSSNQLGWYYSTDGSNETQINYTSLTVTNNQWNHIAFVRNGSTVTAYINGQVAGSTTSFSATINDSSETITTGAASQRLNGYCSNFRFVVGSAVYTSTFTPPTSPLTAVTNTKLLTMQSNRFVDTNTQTTPKTISVETGTPSVQTFNPFTPTADYSPTVNGGSGYFDGTGDYLTVPDNAAWDLGNGNFTIESWVYPTASPNQPFIVGQWSNPYAWVLTLSNDSNRYLRGILYDGSFNDYISSTSLQLNAWNHCAFVRESNDISLYLNGSRVYTTTYTGTVSTSSTAVSIGANASGAQPIQGYVSNTRVIKGTSLYSGATYTVPTSPFTAVSNTELLCNFTNAGIVDATGANNLETVGDAQVSTSVTKWGSSVAFDGTGDYLAVPNSIQLDQIGDFTQECWYYRTGSGQGNLDIIFIKNITNYLYLAIAKNNSNKVVVNQHNVGALITGTTQTATNTWYHIAVTRSGSDVKLFVNGVQEGSTTTYSTNTSGSAVSYIGGFPGAHGIEGYIEDLRITKGYARYTGNFTVPDAPFAYDTSDVNYKQWTPNNFSVTAGAGNDSLVDTPTPYGTDTGAGGEVRGNYATWNPINKGSNATILNGNLQVTTAASGGRSVVSTIAFDIATDSIYCELTLNSASSTFGIIGIENPDLANFIGYSATAYAYSTNGLIYNNNSGSSYGATYTTNDVIGMAVGSGSVTFYKNGSSQGVAVSGLTGKFYVAVGALSMNNYINFGQRPFAYTAPSGFKALCTTNLPEPTVLQGDDYFNTVTWTGDGALTATPITGVGFQPDFVWIKERTLGYNHVWQDAVRGTAKKLSSNLASIENDGTTLPLTAGYISSFDSDGFTLESTGTPVQTNRSGSTYVGWNWKANGAGSSNTDGTITSIVSANQTAGFSVVSYTGTGANATVGHGLGATPSMVIVKCRSAGSRNWNIYHVSLPSAANRLIFTSAASDSQPTIWNSTAPTSTVFSVGTNLGTNENTGTYIAYCFASIPGFSAFGSYTGNGSADGPFIYTGFRPAFVVFKVRSTTGNWKMVDSTRSAYNLTDDQLAPNLSSAESVDNGIDILSNGFKLRSTNTATNGSGQTFIYMAFAENPFKYSLAR